MARQSKFTYTAPDGAKYPLYEAAYPTAFKVYKTDRGKAVIGDPHQCIEALGIKRNPDVLDAYVGSAKDAYIVYKGGKRGPYAVHFVILAQAARVRDTFETQGAPPTQVLMLHPATAGRTIGHRRKLTKKLQQAIKDGTHQVKPRGAPRKTRVARLGVGHRPRAKVSKGHVDVSA